jgi:hypothetical protein
MIKINVKNKFSDFLEEYSKKLDLGGFSNLAADDLGKASRREYQETGLWGEIAVSMYRYGNIDQMKINLDKKLEFYYKTGKGDSGKDDVVIYNNKTRFLDVKASHTSSEEKINYLNLVVPQREYHQNMIYVAAFTLGKSRTEIDDVVLAGFCFNEDIHKRWKYDESKMCVPVNELRKMEELNIYIGKNKYV